MAFIPINGSSVGDFQRESFSTTDLSTKEGNYGIVFPLEEVVDYTPSFSSIITHLSPERTICSHTECRLVKSSGESLEYIKGKCFTYVKAKPKEFKTPLVKRLFTNQKDYIEQRSYAVTDFDDLDISKDFVKEIISFWDKCDFNADTSCIDKENIKEKRSKISDYNPHRTWEDYEYTQFEEDVDTLEWAFDINKDIYTLKFGFDEEDFELYPLHILKSYQITSLSAYLTKLTNLLQKYTGFTYKDYTLKKDDCISTKTKSYALLALIRDLTNEALLLEQEYDE